MKTNQVRRLLKDLKKLQVSVGKVIEDLEEILREEKDTASSSPTVRPDVTDDQLKQDWEKLRKEVKETQQRDEIVARFVKEKTKAYLALFIRFNGLPISTKDSKEQITKQLLQLLRVESTITGR